MDGSHVVAFALGMIVGVIACVATNAVLKLIARGMRQEQVGRAQRHAARRKVPEQVHDADKETP